MAPWSALVNVPKAIWTWAKRFIEIGAREELVRCREELSDLRDRNAELEKALAFQGTLQREANYIWSVVADDVRDGPYCMLCWDQRDKAIRLFDHGSYWFCDACNTSADKPGEPGGYSPITVI